MPVELERQGRVALFTLNCPKVLNAVSADVLERLNEHLDTIAADPDLRSVVITGSGKAFSAGTDVAYFRTASPAEARAFSEKGHAITTRIEPFGKPVIGAINGYALGGGCEVALACDIRLAGESAKFGLPEVKLGIIPGCGGTQRLARLTNTAYAKDVIFTGRMIGAQEAQGVGLANQALAGDALMDAAIALAAEIAERPPLALKAAKEMVNLALEGESRRPARPGGRRLRVDVRHHGRTRGPEYLLRVYAPRRRSVGPSDPARPS